VSATRRVVVVGGGISGLAAAGALLSGAAESVQVTVLEAGARFGGKIRTEEFAGHRLDTGAEAMLARVPQGPRMCRELGLGDRLVAPASDDPFLWTRRGLRPLPPRLLAGVPAGTRAVSRTRILSPAGFLRAGFDVVLPSRALQGDVAIGALVRRRLGNEAHERLVAPLLGGIHAGDCDRLSVRATAPQLASALASRRGLIRGLRAAAAGMAAAAPATPGSPAPPTFLSLAGGLQVMVDALVARVQDGADLRLGARVESLQPARDGQLELSLDGGETLIADDVILAVPAYAAASLLERSCASAASELRSIEYASVATVLLAYPRRALPGAPPGSGFLVPRTDGRMITACTWSSAKWAHLAGGPILLKASVGRAGDERALSLTDEEIVARAHAELTEAMGLAAPPEEALVARFERGLPQYLVGHLDRVARIEAALARLRGVLLAGAGYHGVGVGACIRSGEAAAARIASGHAEAGERQQAPSTV
jgi:oxygen-dependent protoporphyrinogen oxidase